MQEHTAAATASAPNFQDGVTEIMMSCEELRQPFKSPTTSSTVSVDQLVQARDDLDLIWDNLGGMHQQLQERWTQEDERQLNEDLFQHCQLRVATVAALVLERALVSPEPELDDEATTLRGDDPEQLEQAKRQLKEDRQAFHASLARIMEMNFFFCVQTQQEPNLPEIIQQYVAQQRTCLRERVKPSIARLVSERRDPTVIERISHEQVLLEIAEQAGIMIHPLLSWLFTLPPPQTPPIPIIEAIRTMCQDSFATLNEQCQTLTKTVQDWFWEDRNVDQWMTQSNQFEQGQQEDTSNNDNTNNPIDLVALNDLLKEMSGVCKLLDAYQTIIENVPDKKHNTIQQEIIPEWTWKYATLERFLATQHIKVAIQKANPVDIVLGTAIQVPSVVEDAQYLSTRALERAAETQSTQAIGTVAHAISSHVWSVDLTGGVHQALVEQIGCYKDPTKDRTPAQPTTTSPPKSSNSNSFASALLDAFDDDIGAAPPPPAPSSGGGPSSGGLFSAIVGGGSELQQIRIDTDFCNLNGIHSASIACRGLVKFLDGLLQTDDEDDYEPEGENQQPTHRNPMIELAREELSHYANAYEQMLKAQLQHVLEQYCGTLQDPPKRKNCPCIPLLRYYFTTESFELDAVQFRAAEADSRLEKELLGCLTEAPFLRQAKDKCESQVLNRLREALTYIIAELMMDCLLRSDPPKRFTDWGSLLLSKEVRMLQLYLAELQDKTSSTSNTAVRVDNPATESGKSWERLTQIVTVLQLERPADWNMYQSTSVLTPEELRAAMQLRVDFNTEAIHAVVNSIAAKAVAAENGTK